MGRTTDVTQGPVDDRGSRCSGDPAATEEEDLA
jgi:hypothetical protein